MKSTGGFMFRVIIAGGRDFGNYEALKTTMDGLLINIRDRIAVVCGIAQGADTLGFKYAKERGYDIHEYPAEWDRWGKAAGYIRNEAMGQNAYALVAFWDGKSSGTKHMIEVADKYGLNVRIVRYVNRNHI